MKYRVTEEEIKKQWEEYRNSYHPFVKYEPSDREHKKIAASIVNVLYTQNGQDFDDYCVTDENDKISTYLREAPKGAEVLLQGVGTGREVVVAKKMGLNVVGTTLGSRNIEFARRYLNLKQTENASS